MFTSAINKKILKNGLSNGLIIPLLLIAFNVLLVFFPREALSAAREGLNLWFNNVLPSLLPFMIGVNILIDLGFVRLLGAFLTPVTSFLFNVPGAGGFVFVTGLTCGYPTGAKAAANLRASNALTRDEAQRLIGFCNNAGPLFIIGAAGTAMFGSAVAGYLLWASHAAGALILGVLTRGRGKPARPDKVSDAYRNYRAALKTTNTGSVLSAAVANSMETVILAGGYIIFFCVIIEILSAAGFMPGGHTIAGGFLAGLFETSNGVKALSALDGALTPGILIPAAAVIAFGGFSVHAQTLHAIHQTDIKMLPYIKAKILHAALASAFCALMYPLFMRV